MDDADTAFPGNRNGHSGLGHRIHGRTHKRNIEGDLLCESGVQIDICREHIALCGDEKDIIKCKTLLHELLRCIRIDHTASPFLY